MDRVLRRVCLESIEDEIDDETTEYLEELIEDLAADLPGYGAVLANEHPDPVLWTSASAEVSVLRYEHDAFDRRTRSATWSPGCELRRAAPGAPRGGLIFVGCLHFEDERHRQRMPVGCGCIDECCLWPEKDAAELERIGAPQVGEHRRVVQPGNAEDGKVGRVVGRFMTWAEDAEEIDAEDGAWVTLSIPGDDLRGANRRRKKVPRPREWFGPVSSTAVANTPPS
ncbi:hypothetical protein ACIHFC_28545 [Streptomyces sp. NPDC052013]|uniref:hypothetical protein n=1 Tax=Streptomyces sp. NPDC052013 TaxID=3365679 RepID=UPI0037D06663